MGTIFGAFIGLVILCMLTLVGLGTVIVGLVKAFKNLFGKSKNAS